MRRLGIWEVSYGMRRGRYPAVATEPVHGHAKPTTTLLIYAHLFENDHSDLMAALGAMATPKAKAGNVVPLWV